MLDDLGLLKMNKDVFGSPWWVSISDLEIYTDQRPKHYFGIFGLLCLSKDKYHLLSEDNNHFWKIATLTKDELMKLKNVTSKILKNFKYNKASAKIVNKRAFIWKRKHKLFPIKFIDRDGKQNILISINIKGYDLQFDVFWLRAFYKTINVF